MCVKGAEGLERTRDIKTLSWPSFRANVDPEKWTVSGVTDGVNFAWSTPVLEGNAPKLGSLSLCCLYHGVERKGTYALQFEITDMELSKIWSFTVIPGKKYPSKRPKNSQVLDVEIDTEDWVTG